MSDNPSVHGQPQKEIERLLARNPVIKNACSLDLLVFLYRHPRTLLSNEQLATFVGYEMKLVAKAIDAFIDIGLVERTQNPIHAARMYQLMLGNPTMRGLKALLEMASTRQGRRNILRVMLSKKTDLSHDRNHLRRKPRVIG